MNIASDFTRWRMAPVNRVLADSSFQLFSDQDRSNSSSDTQGLVFRNSQVVVLPVSMSRRRIMLMRRQNAKQVTLYRGPTSGCRRRGLRPSFYHGSGSARLTQPVGSECEWMPASKMKSGGLASWRVVGSALSRHSGTGNHVAYSCRGRIFRVTTIQVVTMQPYDPVRRSFHIFGHVFDREISVSHFLCAVPSASVAAAFLVWVHLDAAGERETDAQVSSQQGGCT